MQSSVQRRQPAAMGDRARDGAGRAHDHQPDATRRYPRVGDALIRIYQTQAIRAAYLVTHDVSLAEDIVQSAFIRAYERSGQYDASRPFGPWFLRNVVNSAATAASRRGRLVPFNHAASGDAADDAAGALPDPDSGPKGRLLGAETRSAVWQAIESLPPAQRAANVLRYYLELPEAETAQRLGMPSGTVKCRVTTARGRLRVVLGGQGSGPSDPCLASSAIAATRVVLAEELER